MSSRSTFVTVLAWIFIVGAGFISLVSGLQAVMVTTMFSGEEFSALPDDAPAMATFMSQFLVWFVYGFFALAVFTLVSSIALLKRRNWARIAFIFILSVGVLWQLGGLIMQFVMFSDLQSFPEEEGFEEFDRMTSLILWFSAAIALVISGLFVWLIRRLSTQPIIGEFVSSDS